MLAELIAEHLPILAQTSQFYGKTNVNSIGLTAAGLGCILAIVVPRAFVPAVILAVAALLPSAQRVALGGLDFSFLRCVVFISLARCILMGDARWIRWNWIDLFVFFGASARVVCWTLMYGSAEAFVGIMGTNLEVVASYFVVRCCLRSLDDLRKLACAAAVVALAVSPFFLFESQTRRNLFSIFGGIPELTNIREGKIRCRGAFSHPILAGCFFVAWFPIWIGMALKGRFAERAFATAGFIGALFVVFACASSTPVVALIFGIGVWLFFPLRENLRGIWMSAIVVGIIVHFMMARGIWHLIARIDLVGGSTGYHRYRLIDAAIERFGEWWLLGTVSTSHWGYGLFDVTNQFILEGVRGGVWALVAILAVFVLSFAAVGREIRRFASYRWQAIRTTSPGLRARLVADEYLVFGIGATMGAQMAIFLAVSYFAETITIWQFFMGTCASFCQWTSDPAGRRVEFSPRWSKHPVARGSMNDGRRNVEPLPIAEEGLR